MSGRLVNALLPDDDEERDDASDPHPQANDEPDDSPAARWTDWAVFRAHDGIGRFFAGHVARDTIVVDVVDRERRDLNFFTVAPRTLRHVSRRRRGRGCGREDAAVAATPRPRVRSRRRRVARTPRSRGRRDREDTAVARPNARTPRPRGTRRKPKPGSRRTRIRTNVEMKRSAYSATTSWSPPFELSAQASRMQMPMKKTHKAPVNARFSAFDQMARQTNVRKSDPARSPSTT